MSIPGISKCEVDECAFNRDENCHANAITIGGPEPCCDTYFKSTDPGGMAMVGSVGACKVTDCKYNDHLECNAANIVIKQDKCKADCKTFERI